MVYVLSSGPVERLAQGGRCSPATLASLQKFYCLVYWGYNSTPFHKPIGMYFHIWVPSKFDANGEPL
jgi:hypothetical protein